MTKVKIKIDGRRFSRNLPGSFDQLTRQQAIDLAAIYQDLKIPFSPSADDDGITAEQRVLALQALLKIPDSAWYCLTDVNITTLLMDSLLDIDNDRILTGHPVLKYVKIGRWKHQLPAFQMINSPMIQFVWAESYYKGIQEGHNVFENLDGLVSVLCASRKRRLAMMVCSWMPFLSNVLIDWTKKRAKKTPIEVAFALLQYYHGTRQELVAMYSAIFKKSGNGGPTGPDLTSRYEWWALIHDLAEKSVFGGFYATCYSNMHDIMHHVSYNSDKFKEYELKQRING